jgi:histone H3/H4
VVRLRPSAGSGLRSPLALSEVEGPEFVRFNTIKDYLKEKEKMRSAVDAVDSLTERFNSLIETVITRAVSLAKVRKRTTILAEDMKEALEKTVGKKHLAWEELLQEILLQTPIDLGNLSKGITKYIEDHQK